MSKNRFQNSALFLKQKKLNIGAFSNAPPVDCSALVVFWAMQKMNKTRILE